MEKKAESKRDIELWKRIEAVYPDKSAEYREEVYDLLCPEHTIEMLKDVIASMEKTQTIALPLAFYGKNLKERTKGWSSKGGRGHGKNPAVFEAIKYALAKSKFKTVRGLWECLKREFDKDEHFVTKDSDVFFEGEENVMTIRTFSKRGKTKEHMTDQTITFWTFKTYVSAYKKMDK
jgi:hypothetical protein